ncbi:MAG TPA: DUF3325 domain-containing protein [Pusillimonas sp.]|jgi:hypothetical protein|nr:DUF3325 domain-containing protein [Pusillimonas sp.]|tara:strand:- start:10487 stop:11329 length:843 start_codon:yes stop_codon:yes gene_type:complete
MTTIHALLLLISLGGFGLLALAMPKYSQHVVNRPIRAKQRRLLRILGWLLLAAALGLGMTQWRFDIGMVTWLGWLTPAGIALALLLSKQAEKAPPKHRRRGYSDTHAPAVPATAAPRSSGLLAALAAAVLLIPLAGFAWQLHTTPDKPLMRADAIHGQIGPWPFVLAEKDLKPPEIVHLNVPLKQFTLQFCEGCDRDIRLAYFKMREPRFSGKADAVLAAGNAFEGRGREKTAEIPVPPAANLEDGLWLTVESKNGDVYHQEFDIERVSPALARFIRERP